MSLKIHYFVIKIFFNNDWESKNLKIHTWLQVRKTNIDSYNWIDFDCIKSAPVNVAPLFWLIWTTHA